MAQDSKTRYYRVSPKVWRHAKKAGWGDRETLLALYLLTCPHRTASCAFFLPTEPDGCPLPLQSLADAMDQLVRTGFCRYDALARLVTLTGGLALTDTHGAVLGLPRIARPAWPQWRSIRAAVFLRDDRVCVRCGCTANLECDHILPVARGGTSEPSNLQTLCRRCNRAKGSRLEARG